MSDVLLATSTFPDRETASRIAEQLVRERLAACANVAGEVRSVYWWQAKLEHSEETLVFFKTTRGRFAEFQERLWALHPYDVPEIICSTVSDGLPDYLQWVRENCTAAPEPQS